jgi:hypothetical protein
MLSKIVVLFLIFIAVIGMLGKWHWILGRQAKNIRCAKCNRYRIGKGPCGCGKA